MIRVASLTSAVVATSVLLWGSIAPAGIIQTAVNPNNGHVYHLLSPSTWTDAEAEAISLGAHLVTIIDADEDQWVWNTFGADGARLLWIGLNDVAAEGNYVWTNGEPLTYTNWAGGQPSGGAEDWVQMGYFHPPISIRNWNDLFDVADWGGVPVQGVVEVTGPPEWITATGGSFSVPQNWLGFSVPTASQNALFDLSATYTVTFSDGQTNDRLLVRQGTVAFDLGGFNYNLASTGQASVAVADETGNVASLALANGTLSAVNSAIGSAVGSNGQVMVGAGATWTNSGNVQIGGGTGLLTVNPGGAVNVGGTLTVTAGGTVTLAGGTLHAPMFNVSGGTFNRNSGTLELAGGLLSVTGAGQFSGAFDVENGDSVSISGAGSAWHSLAAVRVGGAGTGNVAVSGGAAVTNTTSRIGFTAGSHGTVTVDGSGTTWDSSDGIEVGSEVGQGTLAVTGGAHLTTTATSIGELSGAIGALTVSGSGSLFTGSDKIEVGVIGTGELHVLSGGVVSAATAVVARDPGSTGTAEVTGAGAMLSTTGAMYVGGNAVANGGTATLAVTAGGNVTVGTQLKVWQNGSVTVNGGTLNYPALEMAGGLLTQATIDFTGITATGFGTLNGIVTGSGLVTASGGTLTLGNPASTAGVSLTGTLNVGTNAHAVLLDADRVDLGMTTTLAQGAQLSAANGFSLGSAKTLTATGSATLHGAFTNGGIINGPVAGGTLLSFASAADGAGLFTGNILFAGQFSPGTSPATVSIAGNVTFAPTATLRIEIGGTTFGSLDQVVVSGLAALGGTLDVDLIKGFQPALGGSFTVMTFLSRSGDFAAYTDTLLTGHLALKPQFTANSLVFKALPAVAGDINLDGTVNIFDINSVSSNWNTAGPQGDANGDGIVNIFDVNEISANWGATGSGIAAAVPEPTNFALAALAVVGLVARVCRTRRK